MNTSQWCSALWAAFCSAPWRVQVTVVLALVLLLVGIVAVSLGVGRVTAWAAGWIGQRRQARAVPRPDWTDRILSLRPEDFSAEFWAIVEASSDDTEASR